MTAPSQCPSCAGVDRHTTVCPESLKVWPARGDEKCGGPCGQPIVGHYTHVEDEDGYDIVWCIGCAAHAAIGATS